ncbi:MFS transporter [Ectothiorhodospiraceae bacterium BW-2]|nr:MFS transporter [Ectothiorhodospiraceae bacterium BW-2]
MAAKLPYWRLSAFYFFYFGCLGTLVPYWGLYLQSLEFTIVEIGQLMALLMGTKIVSPNIWGWIADHTGERIRVVQLGSLLSLLTFSGIFWVESFWGVAGVMLLFSFFWHATHPQFEVVTLNYLHHDHHLYSRIRLWGSVGFILAASTFGPLLEWAGIELLLWLLVGIYSGIFISSLLVRECRPISDSDSPPIWQVLSRPEVMSLIGVGFLMQVGHAPYYAFFTLYMEQHGLSRGFIGQLWSLGVVMEVVIFWVMHRLIGRFGLRTLLLTSLLLTIVRWQLTAWLADSLAVILLAQMLHAASFGLFHAVMIALFHHHFTGKLQGRGQALFSSLSYGAGGAVGSYYAGLLWSGYGAMMIYQMATVVTVVALIVAWRWLFDPRIGK